MSLWEKWIKTFDDRMPIYRQIILQFYQAFVRGDIAPGDRIPSIRDLSLLLKVNTNTVQRVYQEMEREGLISSKRGTGYFFTDEVDAVEKTKKKLSTDALEHFVLEMQALGCRENEILEELKNYFGGKINASAS